jgi:hypothetical protein
MAERNETYDASPNHLRARAGRVDPIAQGLARTQYVVLARSVSDEGAARRRASHAGQPLKGIIARRREVKESRGHAERHAVSARVDLRGVVGRAARQLAARGLAPSQSRQRLHVVRRVECELMDCEAGQGGQGRIPLEVGSGRGRDRQAARPHTRWRRRRPT